MFCVLFRKRSRDEDGCDFMPLSKRINNLHINNEHTVDPNYVRQEQQYHPQQNMGHSSLSNPPVGHINFPAHHQQHQHEQQQIHQHHITQHHHIAQQQQQMLQHQQQNGPEQIDHHLHNNNNLMENYCPELDQNENPFYYDKNKLLYDLHAERMLRNN